MGLKDLLSRGLGGIGAISLVDDAHSLRSNLKDGIDLWKSIVETISNFLFGWIRLPWCEVSDLEAHVLCLTLILARSLYREKSEINRPDPVRG